MLYFFLIWNSFAKSFAVLIKWYASIIFWIHFLHFGARKANNMQYFYLGEQINKWIIIGIVYSLIGYYRCHLISFLNECHSRSSSHHAFPYVSEVLRVSEMMHHNANTNMLFPFCLVLVCCEFCDVTSHYHGGKIVFRKCRMRRVFRPPGTMKQCHQIQIQDNERFSCKNSFFCYLHELEDAFSSQILI